MRKLLMMLAMGTTIAAGAQTSDEPKLEVKPSARILFDAAYVNPQHQEDKLNSGAGIPDMRVGVSFSYDGGIEGARYSSTDSLNHKQFTLSTRWPTRVAKVEAHEGHQKEISKEMVPKQ